MDDTHYLITHLFEALISICIVYGTRQLAQMKTSIDRLNVQVTKIIEKDMWHERELMRLEHRIDKIDNQFSRGE